MEVQHLEQLLDKSELKRDAQEQELFECQDQLYILQVILIPMFSVTVSCLRS